MANYATLPAGKYYIGDPCYIFDESWDELLETHGYFEIQGTHGKFHDCEFFIGSTAYGDGSYFDNNGNEYGVDAGVIGIIDVKAIEIDEKDIKHIVPRIAQIKEFHTSINCCIDNGKFTFGDIIINTDECDEEIDDYDYDYDEEEYDSSDEEEYDSSDEYYDDHDGVSETIENLSILTTNILLDDNSTNIDTTYNSSIENDSPFTNPSYDSSSYDSSSY